jgi:hypothetical protein
MPDAEFENVKDLATTDVVFLGAGFSHAATSGASPLMASFFEDLEKRQYWELWSFLENLF